MSLCRLLPSATVVTPATLTVGQVSPPPAMRHVPSVAYTSANMFRVDTSGSDGTFMQGQGQWFTSQYLYQGPSDAVNLIASLVGAQGSVLPVIPPAQNATWNVTFFGPFLHCNNISGILRDAITLDVAQYINASMFRYNLREESTVTNFSGDNMILLYLAWKAPIPSSLDPDDPRFAIFAQPLREVSSRSYDPPGRQSGDLTPLYVALMPSTIKTILEKRRAYCGHELE